MSSDERLSFDIKRSIILAEYIKCWGLPESRKIISYQKIAQPKKSSDSQSQTIEVYVFPGEDMDQVSRVATIGLSSCKFSDGKSCNSELLMVLPYDIVEDEINNISHYICDISSYILNVLGRNLEPEEIVSERKDDRIPESWPTALLFDEPRGEPNELNYFHIAAQHVKLSWVIPIFDTEYDLINTSGIESFDAAVNEAEVSLVEVRRDSSV